MTFDDWQKAVPESIRCDTVWKMEAYRLGLFASDLAWKDGAKLMRDPRATSTADQLCRAAGNISSNVAEGYSRGTGKDRVRFYEYALGSAREARDWYFKARVVLGPKVTAHRIGIMTQLTKSLIRMSANERRKNVQLNDALSASSPSRSNHQSPGPGQSPPPSVLSRSNHQSPRP
jgi:four helix bundle protein